MALQRGRLCNCTSSLRERSIPLQEIADAGNTPILYPKPCGGLDCMERAAINFLLESAAIILCLVSILTGPSNTGLLGVAMMCWQVCAVRNPLKGF